MVVLRETFKVSIGKNIDSRASYMSPTSFAPNDVKDGQVATVNGASCS